MALAPALVIAIGLIMLMAGIGYWLLKPTVSRNPGLAAYQPPAATAMDYGSGARLAQAEQAATKVAETENAKLGIRPAAVVGAISPDVADRPSAAGATAKQKAKTAHVQKREQTSWQSRSRLAQRERAAQSAFAFWFGRF